jgi:hypothetical protein
MLFLSVRGFLDYAGPKQPLAISAAAVLPSSYSEWSRHPDLRAFRSSIAPPTGASVYASRNTSRCPQQDSRSGWIRYFLSCRALASPTTCRFNPAHSGLPVIREEVPRAPVPTPIDRKNCLMGASHPPSDCLRNTSSRSPRSDILAGVPDTEKSARQEKSHRSSAPHLS